MKISSIILLATLLMLVVAMYASNIVLKKQYDKIDKTDLYWTYEKILEQPFKYLKIVGGNITNIAFEPSKKSSVRIFHDWDAYSKKQLSASVSNDTLYLQFSLQPKDIYERRFLGWNTMVRIFSPTLLSVDGFDTKFGMYKMKQKNISIHLSGKSSLELESYIHDFDALDISQQDSSSVVFEVSPDLKGTKNNLALGMTSLKSEGGGPSMQLNVSGTITMPDSWETLHFKRIKAKLSGASILDVGHAQIDTLNLDITDTSAIILSGQALRTYKK